MSRPQNQPPSRDELLQGLVRAEKDLSRVSLIFRAGIAAEFGLNVTDAECVDYLMDMGPSPAGKLAAVTGLTPGAVTSVIDRLEKAGFVTRQSDPDDRRKVIVAVVQSKVAQVAARYRPTVMKIVELYAGYSDEQLAFLLDFYRRLIRVYEEGVEET